MAFTDCSVIIHANCFWNSMIIHANFSIKQLINLIIIKIRCGPDLVKIFNRSGPLGEDSKFHLMIHFSPPLNTFLHGSLVSYCPWSDRLFMKKENRIIGVSCFIAFSVSFLRLFCQWQMFLNIHTWTCSKKNPSRYRNRRYYIQCITKVSSNVKQPTCNMIRED